MSAQLVKINDNNQEKNQPARKFVVVVVQLEVIEGEANASVNVEACGNAALCLLLCFLRFLFFLFPRKRPRRLAIPRAEANLRLNEAKLSQGVRLHEHYQNQDVNVIVIHWQKWGCASTMDWSFPICP
jgi:hypothetical protein